MTLEISYLKSFVKFCSVKRNTHIKAYCNLKRSKQKYIKKLIVSTKENLSMYLNLSA